MGVSSFGLSSTIQELSISNSPLTSDGVITANKAVQFDNGGKSTSVTIDWNNGANQRVTLTGGRPVSFPFTVKYPHGIGTNWSNTDFSNAACIVAFSNPVDGARYTIRFIQGDTNLGDEVILDYGNGGYTVFSSAKYDPNARNTSYSALFPNQIGSYISVPNSPSLGAFGLSGMTVSAWLYSPNTGSAIQQHIQNFNTTEVDIWQTGWYACMGNQQVFSSTAGTSVSFGSSVTLKVLSYYVGNAAATLSFSVIDNFVLANSTWYHTAITYGNSLVTFYVNGAISSTVAVFNIPLLDNVTPCYIGGNFFFGLTPPISNNDPWNGYLRDISVWQSPLSPAQVALLYNSGRPPDLVNAPSISAFQSKLRAWWPLGDGDSLSTWRDASGNGHVGTGVGNSVSIVNVYPNP